MSCTQSVFLQRGPTDLCNFDPIITCVPATVTELVTSEQNLFIDGFDYTATDPAAPSSDVTCVEVSGMTEGGGGEDGGECGFSRGGGGGLNGTPGSGGEEMEASTANSISVKQNVPEDT